MEDKTKEISVTAVVAELGALPPGALVSKQWLAERFGRCTVSVERAVTRGELPAPAKLFNEDRWTVGSIVRHIEKRIDEETKLLSEERAGVMARNKAS